MLLLEGASLPGKGLARLKCLTRLRKLFLQRSLVADEGLTHLAGLKGLELVVPLNTKGTQRGVETSRIALPKPKLLR